MQVNQGITLDHNNLVETNSLTADLIFPTIVWRKQLTYDNVELKEYINDLQSSTNGRSLSNVTGWQSESFSTLPDKFNDLQILIDENIRQVCKETDLPPLRFDNVWYNINTPGGYNSIHNHPWSVISGVYYVDVPISNMGDIIFHRADESQYYLNDNVNTFFGGNRTVYQSTTGVLLLFPSWLKHSVSGNTSNQNRISLSFNYVWN
jgi:uncharacterized protein (TIGR02466 family)